MHAYLLGGDSVLGVNVEDTSEQVPDLLVAQIGWHGSEFSILNFSKQVGFELAEEGQLAHVDNVKDDTTGPHVGRERVVRCLAHDVGVHVVRCTAVYRQLLVLAHLLTETEVNNLYVLGRHVHQDVVELEVSVRVPLRVHVGDAFNELSKDVLADVLGQALVGDLLYVVKDAHALAQLHDQVHLSALINDFVQFHNVWVPQVR